MDALAHQLKLTLLLITLTLASLTHADQASITFGFNRSLSLPLVQIVPEGDHHIVTKGVLVDMSKAIARSLDREYKSLVIERANLSSSLMNGSTDVVCYTTQQWMKLPPSSVIWSKPILKTRDILISKKGLKPIKNIQDLNNLTLGIVKHYKYPLIDEQLSNRTINAFAVENEQANFMQLFRSNSVDAIIFKELTFDYLYNKYPASNKLPIQKHPLVIEFIEPQCAISMHSGISQQAFNQAIEKALSKDFIQAYLNNH